MGLLITGGVGYIGSAILETLIKDDKYRNLHDNEIFVFDQLQRQTGFVVYRKAKDNLPKFNFILGDITNLTGQIRNRLEEVIKKSERIIHLCSITQQPFSPENEPIILGGTTNLLNLVRDINPGCKRIVNISTTNIYGFFEGNSTICTEETTPNPVNLYAENKVKAEKVCQQFWEEFKTPIITLRLSTNFGYADGIRLDFFLNNIVWNSLFNEKVSVFGRRDNWRPFIHVKDAVEAILQATLAPEEYNGKLYNAGSEDLNLQLSEIIKQVEDIIGKYRKKMPKFVFDSDADNSVKGESYRVDFSKFRNDFNFRPKISLAEGIEELTQKLMDRCVGEFF